MPFELAAFPREWFAAMKLPVVSYALPALIAIGYARFQIVPPLPLLPIYWIRKMLWKKVSLLLEGFDGGLEEGCCGHVVRLAGFAEGSMRDAEVSVGLGLFFGDVVEGVVGLFV